MIKSIYFESFTHPSTSTNFLSMKFSLPLIFSASVFLVACDRHPLNKDQAKQQIIKYYERHPVDLVGTHAFEAVIREKDSGYNNKLFNLYINGGLLKLKRTFIFRDTVTTYVYEVTSKGRPYFVGEKRSKGGYPILIVRLFDYYLDTITDIKYSPDKQESAADYRLSVKNITPFGQGVADPHHNRYMVALFRLINHKWELDRVEIDIDRIWK
jgi:hypothetical protein